MNILAGRGAVSMQNIADELGVSKVTVSKAINGKEGVSGPLRQKILQTAADHGYVLPDYGQRKARTIAIIMSERFHSGDSGRFYMGMYEHINRELRMRAYSSVMITPNPETLEHDAETIEKPGMFDGLIFLGILDKEVRERIDRIPLGFCCDGEHLFRIRNHEASDTQRTSGNRICGDAWCDNEHQRPLSGVYARTDGKRAERAGALEDSGPRSGGQSGRPAASAGTSGGVHVQL